jgi:hypothetical protein
MKGWILAALLVLCPAVAAGQASVSGGVSIPAAPEAIRDAYAMGFGLWGSFGITRNYAFTPRAVAGFDVIQTDEDFLRDIGEALGADVEGGDLSTIFAGFDALIVAPTVSIRPYIAPGAGLAILSVGEFTVRDIPFENVQSEQAFAITVAAGAAVRTGFGPHLLLEARLIHAFTEGDNLTWVPIHLGVLFDLD